MSVTISRSISRASGASVASAVFPNSVEEVVPIEMQDLEKNANAPSSDEDKAPSSDDAEDTISTGVEAGIKDMQMMRKQWSKKMLVAAYVMIWLILFTDSLQQGMSSNLAPYVTSAFKSHSLTASTAVMSSIIGGLVKLPLSKVLDIWGRPQGFALSMVILVVGLAMMAACGNVHTYAAAQVFYWVGFNGMSYSLQIFLADTSPLENRALTFAFSTSPFLVTAWVCGPMSTQIKEHIGFRWGYGMFAIITPIVCLPLLLLFRYQARISREALAATRGSSPTANVTASPTEKKKTMWQTLRHHAIELDIIGLLLILIGMALFLLPFSIYSYQERQWRSPMIIAFLITGVVFLVAFAVYERYGATKTFVPFALMTDRTVVGSCIATGGLFVSFSIWFAFYASFLQVVAGVSMAEAGYITSIFSIGSCTFSFVVGGLIRWSGRFKWIAVYFGVPATILGVVLLAVFRFPTTPIAVVVVAQILIASAGGAMVICDQMALMAAVPHEYVAVGLAIENMFANIGGGIGSTVASALWTSIFPKALARHLPELTPTEVFDIYEDLALQLSHPKGTLIRTGIELAYSDAQKYMASTAAAVLIIPWVSVMIWRNVLIKDTKDAREAQSSDEKNVAKDSATNADDAAPEKKWWHFKARTHS